jgi:hypothetical protein
MSKRVIPGYKDVDGVYVKEPVVEETKAPEPIPEDLSIDDLMGRGLKAIYGIMRAITADVATGDPSRFTVMNLKDVMAILQTLKKDEKDLLNKLSDNELEKIAKK